jgi:hypothetical protein
MNLFEKEIAEFGKKNREISESDLTKKIIDFGKKRLKLKLIETQETAIKLTIRFLIIGGWINADADADAKEDIKISSQIAKNVIEKFFEVKLNQAKKELKELENINNNRGKK